MSIEVSPEVADDTVRTVAAARELHRRCDRTNMMVKIPATAAGIPALARSGVTAELERDVVANFSKSYEHLIEVMREVASWVRG